MDEHPTWKVVADGHGWVVRQQGEASVEHRHPSREAALRAARLLAMETAPSHVVVHDEDGAVIWSAVFSGNGDGTDVDPLPPELTGLAGPARRIQHA